MSWILAIETGGTFTDLFLLGPQGRVLIDKVSSTPEAPEKAAIAALQRGLEAAKTIHTLKTRRRDPATQPALPQRRLLDLLLPDLPGGAQQAAVAIRLHQQQASAGTQHPRELLCRNGFIGEGAKGTFTDNGIETGIIKGEFATIRPDERDKIFKMFFLYFSKF